MEFQFLSPAKVVFGCGRRSELGTLAASLGTRALLVCGSRSLQTSQLWQEMRNALQIAGVEVLLELGIHREPTVDDVDNAVTRLSELPEKPELVVAIGGGAAIDLGKAISAMATNANGSSIRDFLEGVGEGLQISNKPLPFIAIPSTAGTGSEATKNAVISVDEPPCKKSLRSEQMIPDIVIIDPELTVSAPQSVTATSGMDAITQLVESYISKRATPLTQALCLEGLKQALPNIKRAYDQPDHIEARAAMSYAAFLSGMALANSGLGMAHGVAAALGVHCNVPHGLACATLLPIALKTNQTVSRKQQVVLGKLFTKDPHLSKEAAIAASISCIEDICKDLQIPSKLRDIGVLKEQIPAIAAGSRGNSMNGNPRELSDAELMQILEENW